MMQVGRVPVVLLAALLASCGESTAPSELEGLWGGEGVELAVMGDRAALDLGCLRGTFDAPLDPMEGFAAEVQLRSALPDRPTTTAAQVTGFYSGRVIELTVTYDVTGYSQSYLLLPGHGNLEVACPR